MAAGEAASLLGIDPAAVLAASAVPLADWLVVAPTILTILAGAALLTLRKRVAVQAPLGVASLMLLALVTAALLARVLDEGPVVMTMGRWPPPFGIAFTADILGATLAFAASLVALAIGVAGAREMEGPLRRYGFYPFLLLLMTGVCGAFLTGDIFNLYVWFEVMLCASFGLLVLGNSAAQLDGAVRYALLNLLATTFFLLATGALYGALGTLNMADIARRLGDGAPPGVPLHAIAALFILAFGMKAAAFPLHVWLPASYHTPGAAVSALFAALLTKVGVYALFRTLAMLMPGERDFYAGLLAAIAVATMAIGSLGALAEGDLRRILGYVLIGGIGSILAGLALGTPQGLAGAILYIVHSMLAMAAAYLAAGAVERIAGSGRLARLGGLYAREPLLAAIVLALAFALSGLPPFSGLWPKVALAQAALAAGAYGLAAMVLLTGLLTLLALVRAFAHSFWRDAPPSAPVAASPLPLTSAERRILLGPPAALTLLLLAIGVWPAPLLTLAAGAAAGLADPSPYIRVVLGSAP